MNSALAQEIHQLYSEAQSIDYAHWRKRNAVLIKASKKLMEFIEGSDNPAKDLIELEKRNIEVMSLNIAGILRCYDEMAAKEIYQRFSDEPTAWLVLSRWEEDQK